jgi:hypothetical protein
MKVTQPSANPTNKLTAAMVGVFMVELLQIVVENFFPSFSTPSLWVAASPLAVILAGYFIKDDANVSAPVVVSTPAPTEPAAQN